VSPDRPHGIVYLAEDPDANPPFTGYWDNGEPPAMLEAGPGWTVAEDAVHWGRERASVVLIRLWPGEHRSAGSQQPEGELLETWPGDAG
jgi:hypothetical protein